MAGSLRCPRLWLGVIPQSPPAPSWKALWFQRAADGYRQMSENWPRLCMTGRQGRTASQLASEHELFMGQACFSHVTPLHESPAPSLEGARFDSCSVPFISLAEVPPRDLSLGTSIL